MWYFEIVKVNDVVARGIGRAIGLGGSVDDVLKDLTSFLWIVGYYEMHDRRKRTDPLQSMPSVEMMGVGGERKDRTIRRLLDSILASL